MLQLGVGPYDIVQTALEVSVYELRRLQETVAELTLTTILTILPDMVFVTTAIYRDTQSNSMVHHRLCTCIHVYP